MKFINFKDLGTDPEEDDEFNDLCYRDTKTLKDHVEWVDKMDNVTYETFSLMLTGKNNIPHLKSFDTCMKIIHFAIL